MKSPAPTKCALLAGWLLVLTYMATLPALFPAAFSALACVEGSHGIELNSAGDQTEVVLTHPGFAGKPHDAIHHHCLFARVLTAFAEPPRRSNPDHHVKFACGANRRMEKPAIAPGTTLSADAAAPQLSLAVNVAMPRPVFVRAWPKGPPPRPPAELIELKGTLLLV